MSPLDLAAWQTVRDPHQRLERALDELYSYYERTAPMYSNVLLDAELVDFARDAVAPLHTYLEEATQILTAGATRSAAVEEPPHRSAAGRPRLLHVF